MRGYPQFSPWISVTLILLRSAFLHIHKAGTNAFELVGFVLKYEATIFSPLKL